MLKSTIFSADETNINQSFSWKASMLEKHLNLMFWHLEASNYISFCTLIQVPSHQVHYLQLLRLAQPSSCSDLPCVGYAPVKSDQESNPLDCLAPIIIMGNEKLEGPVIGKRVKKKMPISICDIFKLSQNRYLV